MTGYYIEVGYNSAHNNDDVWEKLKEVTKYYCDNPELIVGEVLRIYKDWSYSDKGELIEYANAYTEQTDLTIKIIEKEDEKYIQQYASGGGNSREIKEHLRRAFCRLILNKMHENCMEINIRVS